MKRIIWQQVPRWPWRGIRVVLLVQPSTFWVGVHYSAWNQRWCINLVPCVTLCVVERGGRMP